MKNKNKTAVQNKYACENCANRKKAEARPNSFMAKLWRWHTGWCPGWKAYQAHLAEMPKQGSAAIR